MYQTLIFYHTILRWLVLLGALLVLIRAVRGYFKRLPFSPFDNGLRHWSATLSHIQLVIGLVLYFQSPAVQYFLSHVSDASNQFELLFFGLLHPAVMLLAITLFSLGSAFANRKPTDIEKHKTLLIWYAIALALVLIAIPWPFSIFAQRPFFR